jgi:hypothetical protein
MKQEAKSYEKSQIYYYQPKAKHDQAFKHLNAKSRPRALSQY